MRTIPAWSKAAATLALVVVLLGVGMSRADEIAFAIAEANITVEPGALPSRASMILDATGLDATTAQSALADLADGGTPAPPVIDIGFTATELAPTTGARHWILTAEVKGLAAEFAAQKRLITLTYGARRYAVPYMLTSQSPGTFAWSVKAPTGEISLRPEQSVEIGIAVRGIAATGVRLIQAALIEDSTRTTLGEGWLLCETPFGECESEEFSIPARSVKRLWLRPAGNQTVIGKFTGTVVIGAAQKLDGETLTLSISGTSTWLRWGGVMVILAGLGLAWSVNSGLQNRLNRVQMLLPIAQLRERAEGLAARLQTAPPVLKGRATTTTRELSQLVADLTENALDRANCLPSAVPNPFNATGATVANGYKDYLATRTQKLAWLQILIPNGFEALWHLIPANPAADVLAAAQTATDALDAIATKNAPPETAPAQQIDAILATFRAKLGPVPESVVRASVLPHVSFRDLTIELGRLSLVAWAIFGLLATALGSYVNILSNPGFGLPTDFLICLFWGVGLPIGAQQLSQSTVATAGVALRISVPEKVS